MNAAIQSNEAVSFNTAPTSRARVWTGRVLTGLVSAFLLFDAFGKLARLPVVLEACAKLGFSEASVFGIGLTLFVCLAIHLVPRTAVLGAVLLTGYLGGAICTQVLSGSGAFSIVFALFFGVVIWGGLYLRDARVRALVRASV